MQTEHSATNVLRRLGFLALLGFGVIILSGPILAVLGFAFVGFLVWLPFCMLTQGPRAAGETVREVGGVMGRGCARFYRVAGRAVAFPLAAVAWGGTTAKRVVWFTVKKSVVTARVVGEIGLVTAFGAGVGAVVGLAGASRMEHAIPINALAGGAIAALASVAMMVLPRRCPARVRSSPESRATATLGTR